MGTINPIKDIAAICREGKALFHTDASQAIGRLAIDLSKIEVDLLSFSAHKMYGPKGIGGSHARRGSQRIKMEPLLDGGGHERHVRSGTLPVPLIVGFGAASELCSEVYVEEEQRLLT